MKQAEAEPGAQYARDDSFEVGPHELIKLKAAIIRGFVSGFRIPLWGSFGALVCGNFPAFEFGNHRNEFVIVRLNYTQLCLDLGQTGLFMFI